MKLILKLAGSGIVMFLLAWVLVGWFGHRNISQEVHFVLYIAESKSFADKILRDIPSLQKSEVEKLKAYYDPAQQSINSLIGTIIYCQKNHYDCMNEIQPMYDKFRYQYTELQSVRKKTKYLQLDKMENFQRNFMRFENSHTSLKASVDYLKEIQDIINEPYEESAKQLKQYEWSLFPNLKNR